MMEPMIPTEEMEAEEMAVNVVSVVDDNGVEHEFEILDELEDGDNYYLALLPSYDDPSELLENDGELIILQVVQEDGKDMLAPILDDDEYDRVAGIFEERLAEYYEIEAIEPDAN